MEDNGTGFEVVDVSLPTNNESHDLRIDPFEGRGGKSLTWHNVNMKVVSNVCIL